MTASSPKRLVVYGTLRRGFENYDRFLAGRVPLYSGFVRLPIRMYARDEYPLVVPGEEERPIFAEIFDVDDATLAAIDEFEAPFHYVRRTMRVADSGWEIEIYVYTGPSIPDGFVPLESGRWDPPAGRPHAVPPAPPASPRPR